MVLQLLLLAASPPPASAGWISGGMRSTVAYPMRMSSTTPRIFPVVEHFRRRPRVDLCRMRLMGVAGGIVCEVKCVAVLGRLRIGERREGFEAR